MTTDPLTLYKLIVLYMLDKVKFKLTYSQISGFILEKEYTNFLTLQQVISDLQDAELIKTDASMNRTFFSITEEGRNTLSYFGNRIGDAIIEYAYSVTLTPFYPKNTLKSKMKPPSPPNTTKRLPVSTRQN